MLVSSFNVIDALDDWAFFHQTWSEPSTVSIFWPWKYWAFVTILCIVLLVSLSQLLSIQFFIHSGSLSELCVSTIWRWSLRRLWSISDPLYWFSTRLWSIERYDVSSIVNIWLTLYYSCLRRSKPIPKF